MKRPDFPVPQFDIPFEKRISLKGKEYAVRGKNNDSQMVEAAHRMLEDNKCQVYLENGLILGENKVELFLNPKLPEGVNRYKREIVSIHTVMINKHMFLVLKSMKNDSEYMNKVKILIRTLIKTL